MDLQISINNGKQNNFLVLVDPKNKKKISTTIPAFLKEEIESLPTQYLPKSQGEFRQILTNQVIQQKLEVTIFSYNQKHKSTEQLRNLGYKIGKYILSQKTEKHDYNLALTLDFSYQKIQELIYGLNSSLYKFNLFLTNHKTHPQKININICTELNKKNLIDDLKETLQICKSTNFIKNLVNTPSMQLTPSEIANQAKIISKTNSKIKISILNEKDLIKNKLNLIYSVGMGSGQDSKLIILEYLNGPKNEKPTLLVGKGVTFDSGGLNLKPTNFIEGMKTDMAGAGTVLGFFDLLKNLSLKINVIGIIPTVENLLGHNAYKPGDILSAFNGTTVEITNTDAEGRLILADAISYGIKKYQPKQIIDIATLTGACIAALGHTRTGLISNNKLLTKKIQEAAKISHDLVWPLPLDQYHRNKVKGTISDYKNWTAGVNAGAIMGGAFIEKFVEKKPWAHLDIAGSSNYETTIGYRDKGPTGQPLNLIYQFFKKESLN